MKKHQAITIPKFEPEIVASKAAQMFFGSDEKAPTTSFSSISFQGIEIISRYMKAEEFTRMVKLVELLPDNLLRSIRSMSCDSKAQRLYEVMITSRSKECARDLAAELDRLASADGHNGILIIDEKRNLICEISPNWPGDCEEHSRPTLLCEQNSDGAILMKQKRKAPICPYCDRPAVFCESSAHVYRRLDYGPIWLCAPCEAWVGCHPGGAPLGRLANKGLREARIKAHEYFDRLWKAKMQRDRCARKEARRAGYRWLAEQLGIEGKDCHIGQFDEATCLRVVQICKPYLLG